MEGVFAQLVRERLSSFAIKRITMKFSKASDYRSENTQLSESALLSLWAKLGDLQDDIVLVGGLVPRYICRPSSDGLEPNTLWSGNVRCFLALRCFVWVTELSDGWDS